VATALIISLPTALSAFLQALLTTLTPPLLPSWHHTLASGAVPGKTTLWLHAWYISVVSKDSVLFPLYLQFGLTMESDCFLESAL
jgi:hypothetical protein